MLIRVFLLMFKYTKTQVTNFASISSTRFDWRVVMMISLLAKTSGYKEFSNYSIMVIIVKVLNYEGKYQFTECF